jgi:toxin ParE1/3/4
MTYEIQWTARALKNLDAIGSYIAQDNPPRAQSFVQELLDKAALLRNFPAMGRPGRLPGTRELVVHKNYILPYRVKNNVVQILRVQHAAQNATPLGVAPTESPP